MLILTLLVESPNSPGPEGRPRAPAAKPTRNSKKGNLLPETSSSSAKASLDWNDDDVISPFFSLDTEFVFQRMTEETLGAIQAENGYLILDIGCGRGMDAVSLGKKGGILFGVEPSRIMLRKAMEGITKAGEKVLLVRGLAEKLPFRNERFHRVFCKGALDHFIDPEEAVCEMRRVVLPAGKVVISIANFESLSCFLAKRMNHFFRSFMRREIPRPHIWEIPADHTFKFAYASILSLTRRHLQVEFIRGVSLFWGFPFWAKVLKILPPPCSLIILRFMDKIAAGKPNWGDVLVLRGKPRPHRVRSERP